MRRSLLLTLAALGAVLSLLGAGLFAALTDTATTGTNEISTGELQGSADLEIATADLSPGGLGCGTFADDLVSPLFTYTDRDPSSDSGARYDLCLRNVGSQTVSLTASPFEVSDTEVACTGDEALYDATCDAGQDGELGAAASVYWIGLDCATGALLQGAADLPNSNRSFDTFVEAKESFGQLAPGQTRCFGTSVFLSGQGDELRQPSQTDRLTFRWAFTGAVPTP